jgi:hypothetical protein
MISANASAAGIGAGLVVLSRCKGHALLVFLWPICPQRPHFVVTTVVLPVILPVLPAAVLAMVLAAVLVMVPAACFCVSTRGVFGALLISSHYDLCRRMLGCNLCPLARWPVVFPEPRIPDTAWG